MSKLTIVTITFNNVEELKMTIESCSHLSNVDNLVINGGTCAKTKEFLILNSIEHISEPDEGIADAFNKGIKNSRTDYIMFLNSGDILINEKYIHEAVSLLDKNDELNYVHSSLLLDLGNRKKVLKPKGKNIGRGMIFMHPTTIMRKKDLLQLNGFSVRYKYAMDYDLAVKTVKRNFKGKFIKASPVVLMEPGGVSILKEREALRECHISLKEHGLNKFPQLAFFYWRLLLYQARMFIKKFSL